MRMPAAGRGGAAIGGPGICRRHPVQMVGDRLDVIVNVRVVMLSALALVVRALDHVPEMRDHTGFDDALALVIEIHAPRIAGSLGKPLEDMADRMVSPHAAVDVNAILARRPRLANIR